MPKLSQYQNERLESLFEEAFENKGVHITDFMEIGNDVQDEGIIEVFMDEGFPYDVATYEVVYRVNAESNIPTEQWIDLYSENEIARGDMTEDDINAVDIDDICHFIMVNVDKIDINVEIETDINEYIEEFPMKCFEEATDRLELAFDKGEIRLMLLNDPDYYQEVQEYANELDENDAFDEEYDVDIINIDVNSDFGTIAE